MKPRILIFINSLRSGGAERVVSQLLEHMKDDFDIHLALFNKAIDYQIPAEIKIFDLEQPRKESAYLVFLKIPFLSYKLFHYCRKHKIESSIAFLNRPCYLNALMRSLWGYKGKIVMCERVHQSAWMELNSTIYGIVSKALLRFSYKRADLVIANSYSSRSDLIESLGIQTPIRVIYNPIDLKFIREQFLMPSPLQMEDDLFYFVSVGGFRKEKNFLMLLDSFFIIKHLPVKLIIIGGGAQENLLKQKVEHLGLTDRVIFTGFDSNPFKYVKRSDCYVLSSYVEGFPNVLLEALACGKAVIASDCKSGPREMLAPSTDINHSLVATYEIAEFGILVPVNDVDNMAAAMKLMFEDKELRLEYERKAPLRVQHYDVSEIKQHFHVAFLP